MGESRVERRGRVERRRRGRVERRRRGRVVFCCRAGPQCV